ncbi:MAG: PAS-domain containing protein [Methylocystaceae bacterium]|nr:PAS-domain containing protein [Methylocystaceae bacterium]
MAGRTQFNNKTKQTIIFVILALLLLFSGWLAMNSTEKTAARAQHTQLTERAALLKKIIAGDLNKVDLFTDILAHHPILQNVFTANPNPAAIQKLNDLLVSSNKRLKTSDIFVMDKSGLTLAASNYGQAKTFIGKNYAFRPYFIQAIQKGAGEFLAVGITSKKIGYYISRSISVENKIVGVIVAKVNMDLLYHYAHDFKGDFALIDTKNIIFFSSHKSFVFKSLKPITVKDRLIISQTKQYPMSQIQNLNAQSGSYDSAGLETIRLENTDYLFAKTAMDKPKWTIMMIGSTKGIQNQALSNAIAVSGSGLLIFLAVYMFLKRRNEAERIQTIVDNLPSGVTLFNEDLQMLICNDRLKKLLDFPNHLFENGLPNLEDLFAYNAQRGEYGEGDIDTLTQNAMDTVKKRKDHVFERIRPDGTVIEIRGTWLNNNGFVSTYTDITDRKNAEQEAQRNATYLQALLQHLEQGITVTDENLNIIFWNKAFFSLLELPNHLMKPIMKYEDLIRYNAERGEYGPGDPEQHVQQRIQTSLKFEPHHFERTRPDGRTLEVTGKPLYVDGKSVGFITTYVDITDHKRMMERLRKLADTDPLTDLYNRRHFSILLNREIRRSKRTGETLSVLILGLDHFKKLNDNNGHHIGDKALKEFAKTCQKHIQTKDTIGRLGSDEFGILLRATERPAAYKLAETIRQAVQNIKITDDENNTLSLSVSIGVGIYDTILDERIENLFKRIEKKLQQAKREGRNCVR